MTDSAPPSPEAELARLDASVADFRRLAEGNPDTLYPAHADALIQQGTLLAEMGRVSEGLAAVSEGAQMFQAMARVEPQSFRVHYASALNNLSNRLAENGRGEDSRAIGGEAVIEARAALEDRPDQARFVLVSALINQAGRRLTAGECAGSAADLTSAVEAFREGGAAAAPFLGSMIEALHRSAMAFAQVGQWAEAIDTRRLLVELFPEGAPPQVIHLLALTLQQASLALTREGRGDDALSCADEGLELARLLVDVDAGQYKLFLAQSLGTQAGGRYAVGDLQGGLDVALEAVGLFHETVHIDAGAAVPALILTLETLESILTALNLPDQAATVAGQREQLRQTLEQMVAQEAE